MKTIYKIEFVKPFEQYKVGHISTKFSRDISALFVKQGVAKFYVEKKATKKSKK